MPLTISRQLKMVVAWHRAPTWRLLVRPQNLCRLLKRFEVQAAARSRIYVNGCQASLAAIEVSCFGRGHACYGRLIPAPRHSQSHEGVSLVENSAISGEGE